MDNLIDWFYGQIVGFLGNFFAEMGNMGVELFELDWVQSVVLFFSQLGWALFGVSLVVCIFECGIAYTSGRANIQETALNILKGFLAVCLFCGFLQYEPAGKCQFLCGHGQYGGSDPQVCQRYRRAGLCLCDGRPDAFF